MSNQLTPQSYPQRLLNGARGRNGRSLRRRPARGAALFISIMLLIMLGTMSIFALQTTSLDAAAANASIEPGRLRWTANACLDVVKRWIDENPDPQTETAAEFVLPPPTNAQVGRGSAFGNSLSDGEYVNHPIIGDCWAVNRQCLPNMIDLNPGSTPAVAETYCCCRTGYLFDESGKPFSYSRRNSQHWQTVSAVASGTSTIRAQYPRLWDTSSNGGLPVGRLSRFGQVVGHTVFEPFPETMANNRFAQRRVYVTVTAAIGFAVKEFQAAYLVSGIVRRPGGSQ